jgi:hypothetical protein
MNGRVARRLRQKARLLTTVPGPIFDTLSVEKRVAIGKKVIKYSAGIICHRPGTYRSVYQRLKRGYYDTRRNQRS